MNLETALAPDAGPEAAAEPTVAAIQAAAAALAAAVGQVMVGAEAAARLLAVAVLAEGHVLVEDVPFVVTRVERQGDTLRVYLNDDTDEVLDPSTLRVGADEAPYCAVKGGAFEARFNRAAAWQLLQLADHDEATGASVLRVAGAAWPLRRAS